MSRVFWLAGVVLIGGCAVEGDASADWALIDLSDRMEREPPISSGCGDYFLYARSESDRRAMTVTGEGILGEAAMAGGVAEMTVDLPSRDVEVVMLKGSDLSVHWCTDVLYPYGPVPVVTGEAVPSGGTLTLRAETDAPGTGWYTPGTIDVIMEDVTWETPGGTPLLSLPPDVEMYDVYAGWFPG